MLTVTVVYLYLFKLILLYISVYFIFKSKCSVSLNSNAFDIPNSIECPLEFEIETKEYVRDIKQNYIDRCFFRRYFLPLEMVGKYLNMLP